MFDRIVVFLSSGVPAHLQKEFIYRNANNLHVSEFHALIKKLVTSIVPAGVKVELSNHVTPTQADLDSKDAVICITSVKPIYSTKSSAASPYAANQTNQFQHFIPFTQESGRAHAKTMDMQWKRAITFFVPEYFPFSYIRQPVIRKVSQDMNPIEVSIDDIQDRIDAMQLELGNLRPDDTNNLMRLVQGTVMPQVIL